MHRSQSLILLVLLLSAGIGADLVLTLRTGRARGRGGTITRQKRPEKYWRYVYADCAALVICAAILLWILIWPESF
jgi:Mn2+/Fe2+ NRAMP family transporter